MAFKCGKQYLTYAELFKASGSVATILHRLGYHAGARIGIYLRRSIEIPKAIYGTLRAGSVFVPLDPDAPIARTKQQIQNCGIKCIITHERLEKKFLRLQTLVDIDHVLGLATSPGAKGLSWPEIQMENSHFDTNVIESDLAYIIYTSGSTGEPKGIMHTHYSGMSYVKNATTLYNLDEDDVIATHAPLHFDISTMGYLAAPHVGATAVIIPEPYLKMPTSLVDLVEREKISIWYSVPLALIQWLDTSDLENRDFSNLRWILYGGELFPPKLLAQLMNKLTGATYSNVYGPAEVNQCTFFHLDTPIENVLQIPIGHPWDNTRVQLIDEDDRIISGEGEGELIVHSSTMMLGYWGREDLNAKCFYEVAEIGGRIRRYYRTGDLVSRDELGTMTFISRIDRQVKVRGYRIELDEIREHLISISGIADAAVFVDGTGTEKRLIAVVVSQDEITLSTDNVMGTLRTRLPKYAIPEEIHFAPILPRNSNGKLDYGALIKKLSDVQHDSR